MPNSSPMTVPPSESGRLGVRINCCTVPHSDGRLAVFTDLVARDEKNVVSRWGLMETMPPLDQWLDKTRSVMSSLITRDGRHLIKVQSDWTPFPDGSRQLKASVSVFNRDRSLSSFASFTSDLAPIEETIRKIKSAAAAEMAASLEGDISTTDTAMSGGSRLIWVLVASPAFLALPRACAH